jgi:LPS-assembly protein
MSFPTDNRRRSGVLSPTMGRDDRNGLDIKLPVYLNLAPNYDATLTPRWLSKRGLMLGGEFRYLKKHSQGSFEGTWLPDDDITGRDRSYLSVAHSTSFNRHWFGSANLKHVSDVDYFSDFGDSIYNTSVSLLPSSAGLYGRGLFWNASLSAERWQIANPLLPPGSEPYRRLPRLRADAHKPLARWFEAGLGFEAVNFDHDSLDGGRRVDFQPYVRLPLGGGAWFVTPELAWRYTAYSLDEGLAANGDRSPSRSLPFFCVDAGAYFYGPLRWRQGFIQTLEPRLYYLRVPYRDQDALPLFDTRELTFSWSSLFRDNRFGGADRQADADQLTLAITTRWLSTTDGRERLSMSLGRISYFETPRVTVPGAQPLSDNGSDWVVQAEVSANERWKIGIAQQWDPDHRQTELSSVRSQVRFKKGGLFNAAYRYRRSQLEQTDLSLVLPVNSKWNLYGRWNYSLRDNQTLDALAGAEWRGCCMAVRILGRQYIRSFNSRQNLGLYLEIELNGLGGFGRNTATLLNDAILGYSR